MISFARNPSELVYRAPLLNRLAGAGCAVVVLALLVGMWPQVLDASLSTPLLFAAAGLWLVLVAGCVWMALSVRVAFIFDLDSVVSREWWGTRSMAYSDIAGCTVVHEEQPHGRRPAVRGYRVTFEAMRPGTPPLCLFVRDGLPLDTAIVRRLKTVPGLSRRQLKMLELASSDHLHSDHLGHARERAGEL